MYYLGSAISLPIRRVVDVKGSARADGSPVILWTNTGGNNQRWWIYRCDNNAMVFQGVDSRKCLDMSLRRPPQNGNQVYIFGCRFTANQQWKARPGSDPRIVELVNMADPGRNLVLDVVNAQNSNGAGIQVWQATGRSNQRWSVGRVG